MGEVVQIRDYQPKRKKEPALEEGLAIINQALLGVPIEPEYAPSIPAAPDKEPRMSKTKIADEYAEIAARLAEIKREEDKAKFGEMPKVWPSMAHSDSHANDNSAWGYSCYRAPDDDCA